MKLKFPWERFQLIRACQEFAEIHLWELYENLDLFVVETPVEDPVVAAIMGAGSIEYGLSVFRGPDPFEQIHILDSGIESSADQIDTIGFSMMPYSEMDHEEKKWLKSCNCRPRKSESVPLLLCKRPGRAGELVDRDHDVRLMLYILKGIMQAHEEGIFDPRISGINEPKAMALEVSGDVMNPDVRVSRKSYPGLAEAVESCYEDYELPDISGLPRLKETWVIFPVYPTGEEYTDKCLFVIAHEKSFYVFHAEIIEMDICEALDALYSVFAGDNSSESVGVPRKIIVGEKYLYDMIGKYLREWGIKVRCREDHPVIEDITSDMEDKLPLFFSKERNVGLFEIPDADLSVLPAADDLAGWKIVQKALSNCFIEFWNGADFLRDKRASKQFFGDADWDYYIDEYAEMMSLPTYVSWAVLSYRAGKDKRTYAEELLTGGLPEAVRVSLESLNNSYPSMYRVIETDPKAGTVKLEDMFLNNMVTIHDNGLSISLKAGLTAPFWISSVGNFNFIDIAGPIFGPLNSTAVIEKLQKLKLPAEPTPGWLQENAHIFGRLWSLYDEIVQQEDSVSPLLVNNDGDSLEFITARFEYEDFKLVSRELRSRKDIDYNEEDEEYVWFRVNSVGEPMETTVLAIIYFEDGELKARLNSRGRLDKLIEELEKIKGVRYLGREVEDEPDMPERGSEGKGIAERIPEDVFAAVRERFHDYYLEWLDRPVPALGNKSPRIAAKTKKGAQKVKYLIKSISAPMGNTGAIVPVEEMLKELGLDG